jgi:hypothetical protein
VNTNRFCKCNSETCQPGKRCIGNDDTDDGDDDVLEDDDDNCDVMMLVMIMLTMAIMMFWKLTIVMMIISTTTPFAVELTLSWCHSAGGRHQIQSRVPLLDRHQAIQRIRQASVVFR